MRLPLLVSIFSLLAAAGAHGGENPCEREILSAAARHNIPVGVLYSVGLTETGRKGSLQPYALNIAGRAVFSSSAADAKKEFRQAQSRGTRLIDLGCMQINHYYHAENFRDIDEMLDPAANVEYAARFLLRLKRRHKQWTLAVARYHAGPDNNAAQKKYVCRVISNLVSTGFGKWTPGARTFCRS